MPIPLLYCGILEPGIRMLTNDIKKGTEVQLTNGWYATILDNKKGNIRFAEVRGLYTDLGSVYANDIARVKVGEAWVAVTLTEAQEKNLQMRKSMGL